MSGAVRSIAAASAVGGVLWAAHGTLTMLKPWGEEARYSDSRGYSLVTDPAVFVGYNAPGAAALLVTALAVALLSRGLAVRRRRTAAAGRGLLLLAVAIAIVSMVGVVALSDPVFTAARVAGTVFLGLGTVLLAAAMPPGGRDRPLWAAVGILALGLLPLWPLVYAVRLLPEWAGAAYFWLFGLAWLAWGARDLTRRSG